MRSRAELHSLLRLLLLVVALACAAPRVASAHWLPVASKFDATTSGSTIAFVFALDTPPVLRLLEQATGKSVDKAAVASQAEFFSRYFFDRFAVVNEGKPCEHPDSLARFFWDPQHDRVIAVTQFVCSSQLDHLTIRSRLTSDMPIPHELMGDLRYGRALVRNFYTANSAEANIVLSSVPQEPPAPAAKPGDRRLPMHKGFFASLASALGIDLPAEVHTDVNPWRTLAHFLGEGILHIFNGYDHIAFILTLMLTVASWRQLGLVVTSFTAAHSLTLALATLGIVSLSPRFVEPLIALSVLIVAIDAVARPAATARTPMAFGFGLVHGLGLSSVLRDLGLSGRDLAPALIGFNLGVEIGQLAIVAPAFVLVLRLRRDGSAFVRVRNAMCISVAVAAVFWIVMRVRDSFFA